MFFRYPIFECPYEGVRPKMLINNAHKGLKWIVTSVKNIEACSDKPWPRLMNCLDVSPVDCFRCPNGREVRRINGIDSPREVVRGPGSIPGWGIQIFHQSSLIYFFRTCKTYKNFFPSIYLKVPGQGSPKIELSTGTSHTCLFPHL